MVARRTFLKWIAVVPAGGVGLQSIACDADRVAVVGDASDTTTGTETHDATQEAVADPDARDELIDLRDAVDDDTDTSDVSAEHIDSTSNAELEVDPQVCAPTTPDALGPYYKAGAPAVVDLAGDLVGTPIAIAGLVTDERCVPIANAQVEIWQADADGDYHSDKLRAAILCDGAGAYAFTSIMPGRYLQSTGLRPAHLHYRVSAPGFRTIVTQIYFEGDPYLQPNDSCTTCGSDDPDRILVLTPDARARMDVTLRAA